MTEHSFRRTGSARKLGDVFRRLNHHKEQSRLWRDQVRFQVAACGRRSGKSEIAKRKIVRAALACPHEDGWFVYAAPTRDQGKRIAWADLKRALIASGHVAKVMESELTIRLDSGVEVTVVGMDKPERIEGRILDGIVLDEYANMRPDAWEEHVQPSLSTVGREGWALFIGTPEGRNHFFSLFNDAQRPDRQHLWRAYTWKSADVVSPDEIAMARSTMDPLTFAQEYEASFNTFDGAAYYSFDRVVHASEELRSYYDPDADLVLCLDFNVNPGVAGVLQEHQYRGANPRVAKTSAVTMVLGEVFIKKGSNTRMVAERLAMNWREHRGRVLLYGDATGGNKGTQASDGSDWDIAKAILRPIFGKRLRSRVPQSNPHERARVNAFNARLQTADNIAHFLVDPFKAPRVVEDLECVQVIDGTAGELDKDSDPEHTHLTDAIGYFLEQKHPTTRHYVGTTGT